MSYLWLAYSSNLTRCTKENSLLKTTISQRDAISTFIFNGAIEEFMKPNQKNVMSQSMSSMVWTWIAVPAGKKLNLQRTFHFIQFNVYLTKKFIYFIFVFKTLFSLKLRYPIPIDDKKESRDNGSTSKQEFRKCNRKKKSLSIYKFPVKNRLQQLFQQIKDVATPARPLGLVDGSVSWAMKDREASSRRMTSCPYSRAPIPRTRRSGDFEWELWFPRPPPQIAIPSS